MIEQGSTVLRQTTPGQDMFHAAANLENRSEYGTLILDRVGRILNCGASVEKMFGASQFRLLGTRVSALISGLLLGGSSPSYNARYLACLCADGEWQEFEGMDTGGNKFAVELKLSRRTTDGQEIFLLNVRRPKEAIPS